MERIETVVIGAGQAGLAVSYHLKERGREHVALERGRVGETWRSQRWDGFVLNTPNWGQQLPGFHYQGPEPDAFAPLAEVIAYLEDYARAIDAPVRSGVNVTRVRRGDGRFLIETTHGSLEASNVVVAAGAYQRPTPNALAQEVPDEVFQLHTSDYRRPEQLPSGGVLVVGGGQSGCQIGEELLRPGGLSLGRALPVDPAPVPRSRDRPLADRDRAGGRHSRQPPLTRGPPHVQPAGVRQRRRSRLQSPLARTTRREPARAGRGHRGWRSADRPRARREPGVR